MNDSISRQAAKLKVARVTWEPGDSFSDFHDKCVDCLDDVPSAQPERKTGKWIDDTYCSECGWVHTVEPGFIGSVEGFSYCPNCGAKMEVLDK